MASKALTLLKEASNEPLLTGTLLYILTRGPPNLRARLLAPFQNNLLAKNGAQRLATLISVLKALTAVNVLKRASQALDRVAWNNWALWGRKGASFRFKEGGKEELVVITGGSSGFGYEMVKGFAKVARVVALDVADFPVELASCEYPFKPFSLVGRRERVASALRFEDGELTFYLKCPVCIFTSAM